MRLLLDSHALLWWQLGDDRLPATAKRAIANDDTEAFVSIASIWELAIKLGLGKLPEAESSIAELKDNGALPGFTMLPISERHAVDAGLLEISHRDPFDRMLIAQAQVEALTIVTRDASFDAYEVAVMRC